MSDKEYLPLELIVEKAENSELASLNSIISRIVQVINNPSSTVSELTEVIEVDPPLCAKVLKVANSAYYGVARKISTIQESIVYIGFNTIKELALNISVGNLFLKNREHHHYSTQKLWKHCLAVALCSKYVYRREFKKQGDNIYSAGLLHDIGLIIEEQFLGDGFDDVISLASDKNMKLPDAESELLDYNHSMLGYRLGGTWQLPNDLVTAISFHHDPFNVDSHYYEPTMTLFAAEYITHQCELGVENLDDRDRSAYEGALAALNMTPKSMDLIIEDVLDELRKLEEVGEIL